MTGHNTRLNTLLLPILVLLLAPRPAHSQKVRKNIVANNATGELLYFERHEDAEGRIKRLSNLQYNPGGKTWVNLPISSQKEVPNPDPRIIASGVEAQIAWPSALRGRFNGAQLEYQTGIEGDGFAITRNGKNVAYFSSHEFLRFNKQPNDLNALGQAYVGQRVRVQDGSSKEQLVITQPTAGNWQVTYVNPKGKEIPMQVELVDNNTLKFTVYFAGAPGKKYKFKLENQAYAAFQHYLLLTNPDGSRQTFISR